MHVFNSITVYERQHFSSKSSMTKQYKSLICPQTAYNQFIDFLFYPFHKIGKCFLDLASSNLIGWFHTTSGSKSTLKG